MSSPILYNKLAINHIINKSIMPTTNPFAKNVLKHIFWHTKSYGWITTSIKGARYGGCNSPGARLAPPTCNGRRKGQEDGNCVV
uniref:Uncharacterized protein n=1 Tax=Caenorhabditis japonica TaxID=281687 RepID=A0A8R1EA07_CAEJA